MTRDAMKAQLPHEARVPTPADWARQPITMSRGAPGGACALCQQPITYGERYHGSRFARAHVTCVNAALKVPVSR